MAAVLGMDKLSPKFKFIPDYLMSGFRWKRDSSGPLLPLTLLGPTTHDQSVAGLSCPSWDTNSYPCASVSPGRASSSLGSLPEHD